MLNIRAEWYRIKRREDLARALSGDSSFDFSATFIDSMTHFSEQSPPPHLHSQWQLNFLVSSNSTRETRIVSERKNTKRGLTKLHFADPCLPLTLHHSVRSRLIVHFSVIIEQAKEKNSIPDRGEREIVGWCLYLDMNMIAHSTVNHSDRESETSRVQNVSRAIGSLGQWSYFKKW